jgi:hypothetical protein
VEKYDKFIEMAVELGVNYAKIIIDGKMIPW